MREKQFHPLKRDKHMDESINLFILSWNLRFWNIRQVFHSGLVWQVTSNALRLNFCELLISKRINGAVLPAGDIHIWIISVRYGDWGRKNGVEEIRRSHLYFSFDNKNTGDIFFKQQLITSVWMTCLVSHQNHWYYI